MRAVCLHDRGRIEAFLRHNAELQLYALGDLDDFFWPHTTWYALQSEQGVEELVLVYSGSSLPVLLAIGEEPTRRLGELLRSILHLLPGRVYAHLSAGLAPILAEAYALEPHGLYHKMALAEPTRLEPIDTSGVVGLSEADRPAIERLYQASYPGHWFDPRMLQTGQYCGIWRGEELVSVAGIHVYSPGYRVAALGNIATDPRFRGQGLATAVTAHLCRELRRTVDLIGLNVRADNRPAIACYSRLGFRIVGRYEEVMLESRRSSSEEPR